MAGICCSNESGKVNWDIIRSNLTRFVESVGSGQDEESASNRSSGHWLGWDGWVNVTAPTQADEAEAEIKQLRYAIRTAKAEDLSALNEVIEACVMNWNLPERVRRLTVDSFTYKHHDLEHLELVLAEALGGEIIGVAAWESLSKDQLPEDKNGLLLHGLFVAPEHQHRGIGSRLVQAVMNSVRAKGVDGLLVKAQADATGFFHTQGFVNLPVEDATRDYPNRMWRAA